MKVWVVTEEDFSNEGLEGAFDVFVGVASTSLDALALIEQAAGKQTNEHQFIIGKGDDNYYIDRPGISDETAVSLETLQHRYAWVNGRQVPRDAYWSHCTTWHVREVEMVGFDREAVLAAITAHDAAHGWIVPLPDYDHVHRVKSDAVRDREAGLLAATNTGAGVITESMLRRASGLFDDEGD